MKLSVLLSGLCFALLLAHGGCSSPTSPGQSVVISTVIGNGIAGNNGDGLPAPETALYLPQDVAFGPDGHLYVADWNNRRIRQVNLLGFEHDSDDDDHDE